MLTSQPFVVSIAYFASFIRKMRSQMLVCEDVTAMGQALTRTLTDEQAKFCLECIQNMRELETLLEKMRVISVQCVENYENDRAAESAPASRESLQGGEGGTRSKVGWSLRSKPRRRKTPENVPACCSISRIN